MSLAKDSTSLVEAILSKSWDELAALEFQGALLFPAELVRRKVQGWDRIPVMLKVPREPDLRKARLRAREWAKREGIDVELDASYFDNMDTMCVLSECIRNVSPPHEPWEPFPEKLESLYDRPSLDALWAQIEQLRKVIDPRPDDVSEEQLLAIISAIARARNLVPLVAFGGALQSSLVVSMAVRLVSSPDFKFSLELSERSTQEP